MDNNSDIRCDDMNLHVIYADLPNSVNGAVSFNNDKYTIVINSNKTTQEQTAAFLHECLHIYHGDLKSGDPADTIEAQRHKELISLLTVLKKGDEK